MAPSKTCLKSAKNQVGKIDPHKAFDEKGLDQHGCSNDSFWEDFFPKGRILCQMRRPPRPLLHFGHTQLPEDSQEISKGKMQFLHKFFATTLLELHFGTLRFP